MKNLPLHLLSLIFLFACLSCEFDKEEIGLDKCSDQGPAKPPAGYSFDDIGSIPVSPGKIILMQFVNDQVGYALGRTYSYADAKCYKTTNGGQFWTRLPMTTHHAPEGMIFFNENHGIVTLFDTDNLQDCLMMRTADGGETWEEYTVPELRGSLKNLQLDSFGTVYALLDHFTNAPVMRSVDRGLTWDTVGTTFSLRLRDAFLKLAGDRLYVIDHDENLLVLDTTGAVLNESALGNFIPDDIQILDDDHFILAGQEGIIRSNTGGNSWETIYDREARLIGFSTYDQGLAILNKQHCPYGYFAANDVIASTLNGTAWIESEYNTDLLSDFTFSTGMGADRYLLVLGKWVYELKPQQ